MSEYKKHHPIPQFPEAMETTDRPGIIISDKDGKVTITFSNYRREILDKFVSQAIELSIER